MPELIILTNGPGELYAWTVPLVREIRNLQPDLRIVLGFLPCPFASKFESKVAEQLGFQEVVNVAQNSAFLIGGPKPKAYQGDGGLVLALGGDVKFGGMIGKKLGYPAWRYSYEPFWDSRLEKLFVHDERTREKALKRGPAAAIEAIGNLVADGLANVTAAPKQGQLTLIMAGSRRFEAIHMLGFFAAAVEKIAEHFPKMRFVWPRSRLLPDDAVELAYQAKNVIDLGGVPTKLENNKLITPKGVVIDVVSEEERYPLMKIADLALSIPGTNTLELGIAGVPTIVSLPLQKPEILPLEGIVQIIGYIPILGWILKRVIAPKIIKRFKYVALPNMITDELIQPELRGNVFPADTAQIAIDLLKNPQKLDQIRNRLRATMPTPGTAALLAKKIIERIDSL